VTAVGFSENNQRLVTGSADNTVRFWDIANPAVPRELEDLTAHASSIAGVSVLNDNAQVFSVGADNKARVWKPAAVRVYVGHQGPIFAVAVHPNGSQIATGSADKTMRIFDVNGGNEIRKLEGFGDAVRALAYTNDQQKLVAGSTDKTIRTYNAGNGQPMLTYPAGGAVFSLSVGSDHKTLAAGLADPPSVKVFDLSLPDPAKAEFANLSGFGGPVLGVAVGADNQSVLSASEDKSVKIWSVPPPGPFKNLAGHGGQIYSVAWSPDSKKLATGASDKSFRIWDIEKGAQERVVEKAHENVVYAIAYSPKGDLIATGGDDKMVKFWNPVDGAEVRKGAGHASAIYCVAFRPGEGDLLASGSVDKTVRIWNVADAKEMKVLSGHPDDVYGVAWSPDGKRLASIGYGGNLIVWDVEGGKPAFQQKVGNNTPCYGIAWSPDGKQIGVAASDNKAYIFNLP
jgi:WD40 repeat protein